jgi:hypothetical protein
MPAPAPKPNLLLVERLQALWDPMEILGLTQDFSWLETTEPLAQFQDDFRDRSMEYHRGRIRYFVDRLRAGHKLDPISVDNVCNSGHIYPIPVLLDGNHRLTACILVGCKTIPAEYGGRVDLLRYLEGKRKTLPKV